jgi:membrane-bound acyltransferase YfiQ involved in biofilm formation
MKRPIKVFDGLVYEDAALWLELNPFGIAILKGSIKYLLTASPSVATELNKTFSLGQSIFIEGWKSYFQVVTYESTDKILEMIEEINQ